MRRERRFTRAMRGGTTKLFPVLLIAAVAGACDDGALEPSPVAAVEVSPREIAMTINETKQLGAVLRAGDGRVLSGRAVVWSSSDEAIVTVSAAGVVQALGSGRVVVRARSEGRGDSAIVQVAAPIRVERLELDAAQATVAEGEVLRIGATPRDPDGAPISGLAIWWTSSDPSIAEVPPVGDGTVVGLRPGTVTVTARAHGATATATVTVTADHPYHLAYGVAGSFGGAAEMRVLDIRDPAATSRRLLPTGIAGGMAVASPDGRRFAFNAAVDGVAGIYVVNRDGSGLRLVARDGGLPAWRPDGEAIAFFRRSAATFDDVWVVPLDGSAEPVNLTADQEGNQGWPTWSPRQADGSYRIAYSRIHQGRGAIWTMRADGSDKRQVTSGDDHEPAWSPDGATIAFHRSHASGSSLVAVDAAGGGERTLFAGAGPQWAPAWSPDGRMVAFTSKHETYGRGEGEFQVYTVRADGTRLARRTWDAPEKHRPSWVMR